MSTGPVEDAGQGGEIRADLDRLLTTAEVAALLDMRPATWRGYVVRGRAPVPDDPGVGPVNRRTPRWRLGTIVDWKAARPGKGNRTNKLDGSRG